MELFLAWSMVLLVPSTRKERLGSKQVQPMTRGRCEHTSHPLEVLAVDGAKKIAYCPGCGRAGPVGKSSAEAVLALREIPRWAFSAGRPILR